MSQSLSHLPPIKLPPSPRNIRSHPSTPIYLTSDNIHIIHCISKAKFPIYLANWTLTRQEFAVKVFDLVDGRPSELFENESSFGSLSHPNIIHYIQSNEMTFMPLRDFGNRRVSCILMEYAPHGDFFDFLQSCKQSFTEKIVRTYFHQLIEGLEYLHSNGVYHLDIKLENLLLGKDYQLKIADFDLSYREGDEVMLTRGTKYYRAPELRAGRCQNAAAADVYSAGILLFALKCGGIIPCDEGDQLNGGIDFGRLLRGSPEEFFKMHAKLQGRSSSFFDSDFKRLFVAMTKTNPDKRAHIKEIKASRWYKGPVYRPEELQQVVKSMLRK